MAVRLTVGGRWPTLVDHVASQVTALGLGPFDACRVLVATRETGRVVGQQVADRMGVSAGIDYLTPADLMREWAARAGVAEDRGRWLGSPLDLAVQGALPAVAAEHPLLAAALDDGDGRPGRTRATAVRLARLLRTYEDLAPDLVASWLDGGDADANGARLPEALAWQPELLRASVERLEIDPVDVQGAVCAAAGADTTPTLLLAVDDLTVPQVRALTALSGRVGVEAVLMAGSHGLGWARPLAASVAELPGPPAGRPVVELHDSHGEARQVEVLRDELTRTFAEDPTLEPRDVAIVCPQPERFAALLDAAFAPGGPRTHPGRQLRVHPVGSGQPNPVLELLVDLLRLGSSRASASGITELLLRPALAHRWGFKDRAELVELVSGAGIHWGLDAAHRGQFGLGDVTQNTWVRGLDRLLVGLAVGFDDDAGLGLSGAEAVTPSDMATVGSLAEVVSRLRRLIAHTAEATTVPGWVARCRDALDTLVGLPRDDEWQLSAAARTLGRLESAHAVDETELSRHEFSRVLADAAATARHRPTAGNGSLAVLPLDELPHVSFRVVALLGVSDDAVPGRTGLPPDCVDLGDAAPDPRKRRREKLLDHALAAERLLIVRQARSARTNDPTALPVAVSWLLERLGTAPDAVGHPPTAVSAANFTPARPGFDSAAHAGAVARLSRLHRHGRFQRRRAAARTRVPGAVPERVTVEQLARFLANPAKSFLQTAAGIGLYRGAELHDEVPLEAGGLDRWQVRSELLEAWRSGTTGETVETAIRLREAFPPLAIGQKAFADARADAWRVWERAEEDIAAERGVVSVDVALDLPGLGRTSIVDEIVTHGGAAVHLTASTGDEKLIAPWLESLALAAAGGAADARIHRLIRHYGDYLPNTTAFTAPGPAEARQTLATVATAYVLGQHRLVAVPPAPAIRLEEERRRNAFDRGEWAGDMFTYHPKWSFPDDAWRIFFDADVKELFADVPLPEDPATGHETAFECWAHALYAPLVGSRS